MTNPGLKEKVTDQLHWDDRLISSEIEIEVNDGKVKLRGEVPTLNDRKIAEDDVLHIPGVNVVENYLKIRYPGSFALPADPELKKSLENIFSWDHRLDERDITIRVDKGMVKLEGSVGAYWKKQVAEDLVYRQAGVIEVVNHLNVVRNRDFTDQQIARDIKSILKRNTLLNQETITVEVNNGRVQLKGTVKTFAQKQAALQASLHTVGVTDIRNLISVKR